MNGKLNSDINLSGALNSDFTPNLTSLTGKAFAELLTTKINPKKTKSLSLLTDKLSFLNLNDLDLSDVKTHLSFDKGNVVVKPFKLKYKDIDINVGGSHSFDQNMNYNLTLDVPAKYLGNDVQGLLSKLSTDDQNVTVPITANITGNMSNPSVKTDLSSSVTKLSQTLIKQQKDKLVSNTLSKFLPSKKKDTTKAASDKNKKIRDVLGGLFSKKKKKVIKFTGNLFTICPVYNLRRLCKLFNIL
ncbi:AsmA-like C-terminal region-containing protein [Tenacibaculum retecalamus]|uniref:AsmA-like C-terminal region-containing protein n=1 Tax=Tenacibaculum retecalamus TaxID=3018315 RepID=UPI0023D91E95|nr:AsmA-like C-terminal region-containing protein [Tenacibaculum retecalamus]WBX71033.1 AsmA-like C-terminal region-containing protein [Tenacibaculum retecalamus]